MTFYEHFFWNYTAFHKKSWAWKVGVGGILPDLIYMVGFLPKILSYGSFMEWMHDPLWDSLWSSLPARSAHSFVVWGLVCFPFFIFRKNPLAGHILPFIIGWGLHVPADALTHVSDGYPIFFPLSEYRFPTPVSYWESEYHAREFFIIGHSLMAILLAIWLGGKLWKYFQQRKMNYQKTETVPE